MKVIHHRATVAAALMFAAMRNYSKIVLVGVDLGSPDYFWEVAPERYSNSPKPPNIEKGKVHGTVDPAGTSTIQALPITTFLRLFQKIIAKPRGIQLYVSSPRSKLYPDLPIYPPFLRNGNFN